MGHLPSHFSQRRPTAARRHAHAKLSAGARVRHVRRDRAKGAAARTNARLLAAHNEIGTATRAARVHQAVVRARGGRGSARARRQAARRALVLGHRARWGVSGTTSTSEICRRHVAAAGTNSRDPRMADP